MSESLTILLDQNVPRAVVPWLQTMRPSWTIHHTSTVGLSGKSDPEIYQWAQAKRAIIITFDEDFANQGLRFSAFQFHDSLLIKPIRPYAKKLRSPETSLPIITFAPYPTNRRPI